MKMRWVLDQEPLTAWCPSCLQLPSTTGLLPQQWCHKNRMGSTTGPPRSPLRSTPYQENNWLFPHTRLLVPSPLLPPPALRQSAQIPPALPKWPALPPRSWLNQAQLKAAFCPTHPAVGHAHICLAYNCPFCSLVTRPAPTLTPWSVRQLERSSTCRSRWCRSGSKTPELRRSAGGCSKRKW